jgi:caffeoyl-CoA O-methyltransferase
MEDRFIADFILKYCEEHSSINPDKTEAILEATRHKPKGYMCIGRLPGFFLRTFLLCRKPKSILEVGTFTGYTLSLFDAYTECDCKIVSLEDNRETFEETMLNFGTEISSGKIKLLNQEGMQFLAGTDQTFDMMFLDGRKENFYDKLDLIHSKLNSNGLVIADNALAGLKVFSPEKHWQQCAVEFNTLLREDSRFTSMILPLRDGFNIAIKKD